MMSQINMQMSLKVFNRSSEETASLPERQTFESWLLETVVTPYGSRLCPELKQIVEDMEVDNTRISMQIDSLVRLQH